MDDSISNLPAQEIPLKFHSSWVYRKRSPLFHVPLPGSHTWVSINSRRSRVQYPVSI